MTHSIIHQAKNGHYFATVSQTITTTSMQKHVWAEISNIVGLTKWVIDVKSTEFLSKIRHGVGAIRKITFADKSKVIEYVVGWKPPHHLSYIATLGLPLDSYHATLTILPKGRGTQISWTSFLISEGTDKKQFEEFLSFLDTFYEKSLHNLKAKLDKVS